MNLKALLEKAAAAVVEVAPVAKAVAKLAPKVQQVDHATVLPPHVAVVLRKARAVIAKTVQKEVLMARPPSVSTIAMTATTTDAMTVAPVATNCHVTLILS